MNNIAYVHWADECAPEKDTKLNPSVSAWSEKETDTLFDLLSVQASPETEIYLGPECNNNIDKLGEIITWCNKQNKFPVLFTYGSWICDKTQCVSTLDKIKKAVIPE